VRTRASACITSSVAASSGDRSSHALYVISSPANRCLSAAVPACHSYYKIWHSIYYIKPAMNTINHAITHTNTQTHTHTHTHAHTRTHTHTHTHTRTSQRYCYKPDKAFEHAAGLCRLTVPT
jgi:carbohydrate-binding DOMON domain-containing protein